MERRQTTQDSFILHSLKPDLLVVHWREILVSVYRAHQAVSYIDRFGQASGT